MAAVHGDEVIGVEIARRILHAPNLKSIRGTLLLVPIVNTFGFLNHSRYLPDRRDLNRSFPGSERGSLAARLANLFMHEVVARSDYGIDLHSAAVHRTNLPQVRVSSGSSELMHLAEQFGAPVILSSKLREGSLRHAASERGVNVLVYEAGEGLRYDELSIRAGVTGILRVMHYLKMVSRKGTSRRSGAPIVATSSSWLRSPAGGLLRAYKTIGDQVEPNDLLAVVADPFGETEVEVLGPKSGVIIGRTNLPVVNEGDALFHVAEARRAALESVLDSFSTELTDDPLFDEDEII